MKNALLLLLFICFLPVSAYGQHQIIQDGLDWLVDSQAYLAGYWEQEEEIRIRDTVEVLETLRLYGWTGEPWSIGIAWLENEPIASNDYLAGRFFF